MVALLGLASAAQAQLNVTVGTPTGTQPMMMTQPMATQPMMMTQPMAPRPMVMQPAYVDQSITRTQYVQQPMTTVVTPAPTTVMAPMPGAPATTTYVYPGSSTNYVSSYATAPRVMRRGPFRIFGNRRAYRTY